MADDGLILNFEIPKGPITAKTVFRGGPWKERRRVELRQQNRLPPRSSHKSNGSHAAEPATDANIVPVAKRRKIESPRTNRIGSAVEGLREARSAAVQKGIISSLFSSNPSSKIVFEDAAPADAAPVEPSNAPLTDEQLNFVKLGLSTQIATHLTNNLSISAPTGIQKAAIPLLLHDESDAFIQAQTGSGKTLAYVLPIVDRILKLSTEAAPIRRDSGLFAIIMAPTRELCKQIFVVLDSVLRCHPHIVAGAVMGGEKKKSEKARLRKGMNILVATPGRLADHFSHTEVLDVSSVRWLVLDEGDRLMELGFEEDIKRILSRLDFRLKNPKGDVIKALPSKRISILCSATMRGDVQELGELSLKEAQHITADPSDTAEQTPGKDTGAINFTVPAQLKQNYIVVPAKLRLVTLYALLKKNFSRCPEEMKMIVFFSCADSVDFHFHVLSRTDKKDTNSDEKGTTPSKPVSTASKPIIKTHRDHALAKANKQSIAAETPTSNPAPSISSAHPVTVFRLHGSLSQAIRTSTLAAFSKCKTPALLLCTDIASRGLDLPHVDRIIEFDPAFSREEHLHRVGRTARAGRDGHASVFLMPGCEENYVEVLRAEREAAELGLNLKGLTVESVLKTSFVSASSTVAEPPSKKRKSDEHPVWEQNATDFQLDTERWALEDAAILESARRAFQSHIRAYATHVKDERNWFDIKALHLGHLAKAFGLRDKPSKVNVPGMRSSAVNVKSDRKKAGGSRMARKEKEGGGEESNANLVELGEARSKMRRMGMMGGSGADEFNLA